MGRREEGKEGGGRREEEAGGGREVGSERKAEPSPRGEEKHASD